ncbi:MAG: sigma-70 family RNA polymerase sigma factor [Hydrogenophaga sp.]|uniref:hypothetical protein n=1 Tax=Hydrogenophaga sp. TaxID=1904254 RepID=UPI001D6829BB|nr:hypothetical protein [Hydrogenophaga sp.]MBX3608646.1 sigma-70 family RNA polymerase sigma factor [Hydrogenophaga sp.]
MTSFAPQPREVASPHQVAEAFSMLSPGEQQSLRQIAKLRALGLPSMSWEDLLHEALYRALAGARLWPLSVSLVAFLAQTMRSIASEVRARTANEPIEQAAIGADDEGPSAVETVAGEQTLETELAARQAIRQVEALFSADPQALHVIHGLAEGLTPTETQARAGMNPVQYASAQKRIQRTLARKFGRTSDE